MRAIRVLCFVFVARVVCMYYDRLVGAGRQGVRDDKDIVEFLGVSLE